MQKFGFRVRFHLLATEAPVCCLLFGHAQPIRDATFDRLKNLIQTVTSVWSCDAGSGFVNDAVADAKLGHGA
jgi:hypothetical protein